MSYEDAYERMIEIYLSIIEAAIQSVLFYHGFVLCPIHGIERFR